MTEASWTCRYAPVAASKESTVVARYEPEERTETTYQTEASAGSRARFSVATPSLRTHHDRLGGRAEANVRTQLEIVNDYLFTDSEWGTLLPPSHCQRRRRNR